MAKHYTLELSESEIQALVELRDKGEPAYLRERATARHSCNRQRRLPNPPRLTGQANRQRKSANLPNSLLRYCNCRPMPLGPTQLRSCGGGCVSRLYISINSVMTGRHSKTKCLPSCSSLKAAHSNCYVMSDYYRINKLNFIQFALLMSDYPMITTLGIVDFGKLTYRIPNNGLGDPTPTADAKEKKTREQTDKGASPQPLTPSHTRPLINRPVPPTCWARCQFHIQRRPDQFQPVHRPPTASQPLPYCPQPRRHASLQQVTR